MSNPVPCELVTATMNAPGSSAALTEALVGGRVLGGLLGGRTLAGSVRWSNLLRSAEGMAVDMFTVYLVNCPVTDL